MQASSGEQPVTNLQRGAAESSESDQDIYSVPDVELLQFQKQRSTPKVKLSEMQLDGQEVVHVEVDNFDSMASAAAIDHMGMAVAGTEEQVIRQLHKAGSLDASELIPDLQIASVGQ